MHAFHRAHQYIIVVNNAVPTQAIHFETGKVHINNISEVIDTNRRLINPISDMVNNDNMSNLQVFMYINKDVFMLISDKFYILLVQFMYRCVAF